MRLTSHLEMKLVGIWVASRLPWRLRRLDRFVDGDFRIWLDGTSERGARDLDVVAGLRLRPFRGRLSRKVKFPKPEI